MGGYCGDKYVSPAKQLKVSTIRVVVFIVIVIVTVASFLFL